MKWEYCPYLQNNGSDPTWYSCRAVQYGDSSCTLKEHGKCLRPEILPILTLEALDRLTAAVERLAPAQREWVFCADCASKDTCQRVSPQKCVCVDFEKAPDPPRTCGECAMWPRHKPQNHIVCNAADFFGFDHPCTQPTIFKPREVTP